MESSEVLIQRVNEHLNELNESSEALDESGSKTEYVDTEKASGLQGGRDCYLDPESVMYHDEQELVERFDEWRKNQAYVILRHDSPQPRNSLDERNFCAIPVCKRGDSFYTRKTLARFHAIEDGLKENYPEGGKKWTSTVMATLTFGEEEGAWQRVGEEFNKFMSRLRRYYDCKIDCIRVWESQKNGRPHIHAILMFRGKKFRIFRYNRAYRFKHRPEKVYDRSKRKYVHGEEKHPFRRFWTAGFSDWKGVYDVGGAIGYLMKYLVKTLTAESYASRLTLAKLWVHRKRMFSISTRLTVASEWTMTREQVDLNGYSLESWTYLGVVHCDIDLGKKNVLIHDVHWKELSESQVGRRSPICGLTLEIRKANEVTNHSERSEHDQGTK